ncbi:DUF3298 domain-containing protein [Natronincola ferrireducens]|uniref:DUF3298 domain-containing protein n=1 Tax=Natronincola ferrireducens TaxID=393762 RepID=A0A1G9FW70_9FIRM|nr:DUF3298 domain-containing protein [Natronincola ferrireducens]SDK92598.1 Protein of unknown function [Natronincola ferrireducens]
MKDNDKKAIDFLKTNYENTVIPNELDFLTKKIIKESRKKMKNNNKITKALVGTAAAGVLFIGSINFVPFTANAMSEIPIVGVIVKTLTFRNIDTDDKQGNYDVNIQAPLLDGLANKDLENILNEKYLEESRGLYESFIEEVDDIEALGGGSLGVHAGYEIKTDTDSILSIGRYIVNTVGSSSTTFQYDTIDKKNQLLITLPSLFKDSGYIEVISANIIEQMKEDMEKNPDKVYWIGDNDLSVFEKIDGNQSFYINKDNKLVISFDKYEVAPGYMGVVEFEIPTEVLGDVLVSHEYVR